MAEILGATKIKMIHRPDRAPSLRLSQRAIFEAVTFDEAHKAIKRGDVITLRRALNSGLDVNLANRFSWTLLMLAAIEDNCAMGDLLISRGASLDTMTEWGDTALSLAAHGGHARFLKMLLARGASVKCQPHGHTLEWWVTKTSGLPIQKLALVLKIISKYESN